MDVGVGSFVFSLGLISARPFLAPPNSTTSKRQLWPSLLKSIKGSIPTIFLGLVRVAMVKGVEYPVRSVNQFSSESLLTQTPLDSKGTCHGVRRPLELFLHHWSSAAVRLFAVWPHLGRAVRNHGHPPHCRCVRTTFAPFPVFLCSSWQTSLSFSDSTLRTAHQVALSFGGLQSWTLEAPRDNLISANKEGLISFPGESFFFALKGPMFVV